MLPFKILPDNNDFKRLLELLSVFPSIGVAYSGGVDSTLAAYGACCSIGAERVKLFRADTGLMSERSTLNADTVVRTLFGSRVHYETIRVAVLSETKLYQNDPDRCYFCKRKIFSTLLLHCQKSDLDILIDGTNRDDLTHHRPGLRALTELGIYSPLADGGIDKKSVRNIAEKLAFPNALTPSDSCVATRLQYGDSLSEDKLKMIERHEAFLHQMAFYGCRVRPRGNTVILELMEKDFPRMMKKKNKIKIMSYFHDDGFQNVLFEIRERQ